MQPMTDLALPILTASPTGIRDGAGPQPGVVVIHEGMGITPQLIRFVERVAREGYVVAAPDLFFRVGGPESSDFGTMIGSVTPEQLQGDLATTVAHLRALGATSIGVTGFCMGGLFTYRAAKWAGELGVDAAVAFYGGGISRELGDLGCPAILFFGGSDPYVPISDIEQVQARHGELVQVYAGADHGFMRDGSDSYSDTAAPDAWSKLTAFFGEHLRSS
jgi:carboxymethylenebutenolidase